MQKHAYLIIAHKDDETFRTLLEMLDDERNDLFIHMDRKAADFDQKRTAESVRHAGIYFTERTGVNWGAYSLVHAELVLLKLATTTGHYNYYHLLSGQDLPIKSQDEIHAFFDGCGQKEFLRFENEAFRYPERVSYYYFFQESVGRGGKRGYAALNKLSIGVQKLLHLRRNREIRFQKGTQWFSITDDLARLVVEKEPWIRKVFRFTVCADELFLQTIVENSEFKQRLYRREYDNDPEAMMRLIDWERGNPYVFRKEDFELLTKSEMLWARKFDSKVDMQIIRMLAQAFSHKNG